MTGRQARGCALVGGIVAAVLASAALPSSAQSVGPDSFDVTAQGAAIVAEAAAPAVLPLQAQAGLAVSTVNANNQPFALGEAAPVYFPLAALLAADTPVPAAITCTSHAPGEPAESSCGGPAEQTGLLSVGAASGSTSASSDPESSSVTVQASARGSDIAPAVVSAVPVKVENVASAASAKPHEGRMTAGASAAVHGIDVAGVLHISSVESSASVAAGGTPGSASHDVEFALSGAEVAGIPVTIDENGLTVDGEAAAPGVVLDLQDQVNTVLEAAGLSVSVVPAESTAESTAEGTFADARSPGLRVRFSNDQSGIFAEVILARSEAQVAATKFAALTPANSDLSTTPAGPQPSVDPDVTTSPATTSSPATATELPSPALPSPPEPGASAPEPSDTPFLELGAPARVVLDDWLLVYPPFALLVFALPALFVLRRLPISTAHYPFSS